MKKLLVLVVMVFIINGSHDQETSFDFELNGNKYENVFVDDMWDMVGNAVAREIRLAR